jgi:hypothetical protein
VFDGYVLVCTHYSPKRRESLTQQHSVTYQQTRVLNNVSDDGPTTYARSELHCTRGIMNAQPQLPTNMAECQQVPQRVTRLLWRASVKARLFAVHRDHCPALRYAGFYKAAFPTYAMSNLHLVKSVAHCDKHTEGSPIPHRSSV